MKRGEPPADRILRDNPVRRGWSATAPEESECAHGVMGMWSRWEWRTDTGSEEDSEPVILEDPAACHECNCSDPFCRRCWE